MSGYSHEVRGSSRSTWLPQGVPLVTAMQDSSRRDNICTVIQLSAYPIAGILLLIGLCLYQWLS